MEGKGSSFCFSRSENCNKRQLGNTACYRGVDATWFSIKELHRRRQRGREQGCAHSQSGSVPGPPPTQEDGEEGVGEGAGEERGGTRVGQTFPWQDPWDTAEARVQPLKERMRAWQSITGLHLHNKWSFHSFSGTRSLARTYAICECIHSGLINTRQRRVRYGDGGRRRREGGRLSAGVALCKHYLHVCIKNSGTRLWYGDDMYSG